uniref:C2H2-type domain-containing protein n=1 Tax=Macrostomum lignano TaxID=282301 RepID=A0A1I8JLT2_9PLAT
EEFWRHRVQHMRPDRVLRCSQCPFVTEYKHHMKYHAANHSGSRPYKCPNCDYVCINRSMLNSHLRSHSANRAHRCHDCGFTTKFVHNLHLHTRRFGHRGGDCDGSADGNKTAGRRRRLPERSTRSSAGAGGAADRLQLPPLPRPLRCNCRQSVAFCVQHPPPPPRPPPPPPLPPPASSAALASSETSDATTAPPAASRGPPVRPMECRHCGIVFRNFVLCNGCGFQAYSELGFNMH